MNTVSIRSLLAPVGGLILAVMAGLVLLAPSAAAHASLTSANPGADESVEVLPGEIRLAFTDKISAPAHLVVTAPDGTRIVEREAEIDRNEVFAAIPESPYSGQYRVDYKVISADGHPVDGAYRFTVEQGAAVADPANDEALESEEGNNYFLYAAIAVFVILVLIVGWVVLRKPSDENEN